MLRAFFFFFQAEDGIRDKLVTGVQRVLFRSSIVFEDEHVLVLDKRAGVVVHPGAGHARGTLAAALLAHAPAIAGVGGPRRPGIVHRLDKDTSGLLVVAKNRVAYDALVAQLAGRSVTRRDRKSTRLNSSH